MRSKALLAGAGSSFEGPWVRLEAGEWLVEPSPEVGIRGEDNRGPQPFVTQMKEPRVFRGPTRIKAIVSPDYNGPGIFLTVRQISNGAKP